MLKYLWHKLIQGHSWKIIKVAGGNWKLYVLLECQKCHNVKVIKSDWVYEKYSYDPKTAPVGIDDLLNKIKGK